MGLRRHDVGSESVARMSQGQVVAGLSSIPPAPRPQRMAFCSEGAGCWIWRCLLLILAVLTRYPSGCFTTSPDVRWSSTVNYLLTQQ